MTDEVETQEDVEPTPEPAEEPSHIADKDGEEDGAKTNLDAESELQQSE